MLWLEEPVIPDDFTGTKRVGDEGGIAIAGGENLHTIHEFTHAITVGRLDYPEPDASNIGKCRRLFCQPIARRFSLHEKLTGCVI